MVGTGAGRSEPRTNLLGEVDVLDGEQPVAERLDGAVGAEARGPLRRGLAGLGDGARGEQRHVAPSRGGEGRESPGERGGGEREDEALPGDRELVAERGQRRRQLARPRGLVGDRRHRVRQHRVRVHRPHCNSEWQVELAAPAGDRGSEFLIVGGGPRVVVDWLVGFGRAARATQRRGLI
jgi:hypothetical protein